MPDRAKSHRNAERVGWIAGSIAMLLVVALGIYTYVDSRGPKRVFLTRSQTFQAEFGVKGKDDIVENDTLEAEKSLSWLIAGDPHCIVLTHDKKQANYIVEITVERYPEDPISGDWASASLSVTRGNGDVFLIDSFFQNRNSREDIAQQPIARTWEVL